MSFRWSFIPGAVVLLATAAAPQHQFDELHDRHLPADDGLFAQRPVTSAFSDVTVDRIGGS